MYEEFGERIGFYLVYIREAHPTDGWQVRANEREKILVAQPKTFAQRTDVAREMCSILKVEVPTLIDGLDDRIGKEYAAWPDRLYLVGRDGRVAYKSGPGPWGFKPAELQEAIEKELGTADVD